MHYSDLLQKLYSMNRERGIQPGLETISSLSMALGLPHTAYPAVHIAGTNGKGSVSTKIAAAFELSGYKVGLYTSPHIATFRERICMNSQMISEEEVVFYCQKILKEAEFRGIKPTFFELVTALAFLYFAEKEVDIAVFETGLGGRLDATNICMPLLSVITSISLDHTQILGSTIEEIAYEKAGIMKEAVSVITGNSCPEKLMKELAQKKGCPLHRVQNASSNFEEENQDTARLALHVLSQKMSLEKDAIEEGLQKVPPCRFEIIDERIVLDVAHNPDGIAKLFHRLESKFPGCSFHTLYGASGDKDIENCLKSILPKSASTYFVEAKTARACKADDLLEKARSFSANCNLFAFSSLPDAVQCAIDNAKENDGIVVVCGSFYIMKQIRQYLNMNDEIDPVPIHEGVAHARVY